VNKKSLHAGDINNFARNTILDLGGGEILSTLETIGRTHINDQPGFVFDEDLGRISLTNPNAGDVVVGGSRYRWSQESTLGTAVPSG
jgi:hypothetical protein